MAKAAVTGVLFLAAFVVMGVVGATVQSPDAEAGGGFQPGADVGLDAEQLQQAARALRVADRLHAQPLPVLAMVVAALGESGFRAIPNGGGSGYCGVFQAHPKNIPCNATEEQAKSFLKGGRGFQAGGAIRLARTVSDPGVIATRVEASGKPGQFYGKFRPQAERIIAAWRAGGLAPTPPFGDMEGSPKHIIDSLVLPIAASGGIVKTAAQNDADNHVHTHGGNGSDHAGPPDVKWAADLGVGQDIRCGCNRAGAAKGDRVAKMLAERFEIPWTGSGLVSASHDGYRFQLIWRFESAQAGNHYHHVHFGVAAIAGPPSP